MRQEQDHGGTGSGPLHISPVNSPGELLDRAGVSLTPRRDGSGEIVAVGVRDCNGRILLELSPAELCILISRRDEEIELWVRALQAGPKHL